MINNKQKALLHVAKAELGLSEEEYRDILRVQGGVDSSVHLNDFGFEKVLAVFRKLGFRKTAARRKRNDKGPVRQGGHSLYLLASEAQRKILYHLMEDLGWWPARLFGFLRKVTGKEKPEQLSSKEAQKAIEALKAMRDRNVQWH